MVSRGWAKLAEVNGRLKRFRKFVEPARSRRIAHMDLRAQMQKETLGACPAGADNTAFQETTGAPFSLPVGGSTDTDLLVTALTKAELFDQCQKCSEIDRFKAILDAEQSR